MLKRISINLKALISGLSVVRPEECIPWLIEKLELLNSIGIRELKWYLV
jgi:hypothetical protein